MGYTIVEPAPDLDIEEIIETADQEMYKMKKAKKAARRDWLVHRKIRQVKVSVIHYSVY